MKLINEKRTKKLILLLLLFLVNYFPSLSADYDCGASTSYKIKNETGKEISLMASMNNAYLDEVKELVCSAKQAPNLNATNKQNQRAIDIANDKYKEVYRLRDGYSKTRADAYKNIIEFLSDEKRCLNKDKY